MGKIDLDAKKLRPSNQGMLYPNDIAVMQVCSTICYFGHR
jgi:hypothetical protein